MAFRRSEMWLWRFIGVFSLAVCSLNVMVLWRAPPRTVDNGSIPNTVSQLQPISGVVEKPNTKPQEPLKDQKTQTKTQPQPPLQVVKGLKMPATKDEIVQSVKILPFLTSNVSGMLSNDKVIVLGKQTSKKAFLTIGVPSVKRKKAFYLPDTLRGLVDGLAENEKSEVQIVVFIPDFNENYIEHVKVTVEKLFTAEVASGLIKVIVPPRSFYPSFRNLPLFFEDSIARVHWRSKQALDYSFLYFFCADRSEYFMQLEDDVTSEKNYLPEIKKFIKSRSKPWSTLEFGARGFIGMMYKSEHLLYLARYCRVNFFVMPIDWLFRVYNDIWLYGNDRSSVRKPPLFKHIGTFSSLDGQVRKLEDVKKPAAPISLRASKLFKNADNPPADVLTTIADHVPGYAISDSYGKGSFWGKTIKEGNFVTVMLKNPVNLKRVAFASGSAEHLLDSFQDTEVFVSSEPTNCVSFTSLRKFTNTAVVDVPDINVAHPVKCIKLTLNTVKKDEYNVNRWLIISEIAVWVKK